MSEDYAAIAEALEQSGLWTHPAMEDYLSSDEAAQLAGLLADPEVPTFVVLRPLEDGDAWDGDPETYLSQLHDVTGEPGVYLMVDSERPYEFQAFTAKTWGDYDLASYQVEQAGGDGAPEEQLLAAARSLHDGTVVEDAKAQSPATSTGMPAAPEEGVQVGDVVLWGGLALVVLCLVRYVLAPAVRKSRREAVYTLPASVESRAMASRDDSLRRTASEEVLALGEALDQHEMDELDEVSATSWQAALDHYELARGLVDDGRDGPHAGSVEPADLAGAVVLARRGWAALDSALARRAFTPERPCFLNPLHPTASVEDDVQLHGRRVSVPLCARCRRDLTRRHSPDIFDITRHGRTRHYFETEAEPWASTGYGALGEDLLDRVRGRARDR